MFCVFLLCVITQGLKRFTDMLNIMFSFAYMLQFYILHLIHFASNDRLRENKQTLHGIVWPRYNLETLL